MATKARRETLGQSILRSFGLARLSDVTSLVREKASAAYRQGFREATELSENDDPADASLGLARGGFGYRRGRASQREGGITFEDNLKTAWDLWQSNGILQRDAEITRDYVAGGVIETVTKDDRLTEIIDEFVERNNLWRRVGEFALQLGVLGTQCFPAFVRQSDGAVTLGYVDPEEIERVIPHPDNAMEMWAVVTKPRQSADSWQESRNKRVYRIIRRLHEGSNAGKMATAQQAQPLVEWEAKMLQSYSLTEYSGQCFYIKVNAFSNQPTGYSDIITVADLSDQWDQTLFALGQREQFADFFSFDVTANGFDDEQCRDKAREISMNPPSRGSVNVHNDAEKWEIFAPDLKQTASVATAQEQRKNIIAILGKPEAWFGSATGAHLSTIQAQGDPTWRSLKYRQNEIKWLLEDMLNFQRDQAIIAGTYIPLPDADTSIAVTMPEMTSDDTGAVAAAISGITAALMTWEERGWIQPGLIPQIIAKLLNELGISVSSDEIEAPLQQPEMGNGEKLTSPLDWFKNNAPLEEK